MSKPARSVSRRRNERDSDDNEDEQRRGKKEEEAERARRNAPERRARAAKTLKRQEGTDEVPMEEGAAGGRRRSARSPALDDGDGVDGQARGNGNGGPSHAAVPDGRLDLDGLPDSPGPSRERDGDVARAARTAQAVRSVGARAAALLDRELSKESQERMRNRRNSDATGTKGTGGGSQSNKTINGKIDKAMRPRIGSEGTKNAARPHNSPIVGRKLPLRLPPVQPPRQQIAAGGASGRSRRLQQQQPVRVQHVPPSGRRTGLSPGVEGMETGEGEDGAGPSKQNEKKREKKMKKKKEERSDKN